VDGGSGGKCTIQSNNLFDDDMSLVIKSMIGLEVLKVKLPTKKQLLDIDVASLSNGAYNLIFYDNNSKLATKKLILIK
jgi:hypothetical protein